MRKFRFIIAAFAAAIISLGAYAQENGNRDANGYIVRGPYLTNGGGSNWFLGIGGGFNTTFGEAIKPLGEFTVGNNWTAEAFVGKWFTPAVGFRAGYKGGMTNFAYGEDFASSVYGNGEQARFGYAHGDFMWNLSDALSGYKETRTWDVIPYVGAGIFGLNNGYTIDRFALNAGVYNKFRLGDVVSLYLDLNLIGTGNTVKLADAATKEPVVTPATPYVKQPVYVPTATVGLTFNIGTRKNFDRYSSVAPEKLPFTLEQYNDLANRNGALEQENGDLKGKLNEALNKKPEVVYVKEEAPVVVNPLHIYFDIDKVTLTNREKAHLENWLATQTDKTKELTLTVTGSADSKTGTPTYNQWLAEKRAESIRAILAENGFKNVNVKAVVGDGLGDTPAKNRVVVIQ